MGSIGLPELIAIVFLGCGLALYFLPTVVAALRRKKNIAPILIVNLFLGWSVIGWVVSLVWALSTEAADVPPVMSAVLVQPAVQPTPRHTAVPTGKLCIHCGKYSQPEARFCASCGQAFA